MSATSVTVSANKEPNCKLKSAKLRYLLLQTNTLSELDALKDVSNWQAANQPPLAMPRQTIWWGIAWEGRDFMTHARDSEQ